MALQLSVGNRFSFIVPSLAAALLCLAAVTTGRAQTVAFSTLGLTGAGYRGPSFGSGSGHEAVAQAFTTGGTAMNLSAINLAFNYNGDFSSGFSLAVYSNNSGAPGTLLETLSGASEPNTTANYSYTSGTSTLLSANTTYWWVATVTPSGTPSFNILLTASPSGTNGNGWSIGNAYTAVQSDTTFSSFSAVGGRSFQFSVETTSAIPEPSTYAALAGAAVLGLAVYRRRRSA